MGILNKKTPEQTKEEILSHLVIYEGDQLVVVLNPGFKSKEKVIWAFVEGKLKQGFKITHTPRQGAKYTMLQKDLN